MDDTPILDISLKEYYNTIQKGGYVTRKKTESAKGNIDKSHKNIDSIEIPSVKKVKEKAKIKVKNDKKDEKNKKNKKKQKLQKKKYSLIDSNTNSNIGIHNSSEIKKRHKEIKKIKTIRKDNNTTFPIDYEIVPYNDYFEKNCKTIFFDLSEKLKYNKIINFENYKERFLLFKYKKEENSKYTFGIINEIKIDEDKHLIIQIRGFNDVSYDNFPFLTIKEIITIDSKNYELYLIEFSFCLKNNDEADYFMILTEFLGKNDITKTVIDNKYYVNCFSFKKGCIISKVETTKLILLEELDEESNSVNYF